MITLLCVIALVCALATPRYAVAQETRTDTPRFDIWEYQIEGNTSLDVQRVERAVYPYLGPRRGIDDVEQARQALERTYHEAGYLTVSVTIPEQRVDAGLVKLQVLEGRLGKVRVTGSRYYSQGQILTRMSSAQEGTVPNFPKMQRELETLNRTAGRAVVPVMRPGQQTGTADMDLSVQDRAPGGASVELNNHYSPNTSYARLVASAHYDNLWQRDHSVSFQYQASPGDWSEVRAYGLNYLMPWPGSDNLLAFYGVVSRSNVAALGDLTVLGRGEVAGARFVMPLHREGSYSHSLTLGWDYKNFEENLAQAGLPASETPITYAPFTVSYGGFFDGQRGTWQFTTGVSFAVRGLVSKEQEFADKRFLAQGNYVALRWDVQRVQRLSDALDLFLRLDGQIADQPLVSNEQFVGGGASSVRGYLEAEVLGDDGMHGVIELRGPPLGSKDWKWLPQLRPHVFVEGAHVHTQDALPTQQAHTDIWSAGIGLRTQNSSRLGLALDLAWPFESTTYTTRGNPRLQFSTVLEF